MNVLTFKLVNGEEIIADVSHVGDDYVHMENAMVLQIIRNPENGEPMRAFADWPALAAPGQQILVPISGLLTLPMKAHEELARQFTANVTGLELPPAQPKILLS